MLAVVQVHNFTGAQITVHSEVPGDTPHPGVWVTIGHGEWADVWVLDPWKS